MGLLDKFKKKNRPPQFNMYGPNQFTHYQQPYPTTGNPYSMRPSSPGHQAYPGQQSYHQNYMPPFQQQQIPPNSYSQQAVQHYAHQPQLNAHQQYLSQNKLLQSVPFQNQPVMQPHNSNQFQQQAGPQSQYPMTGQPPERQEGGSPGFFSRILGGDTSITGIIGNMQRAVQTAQQVTPMISQYSPLVKNFPSLYKIFKEVNTDDPKEKKSAKSSETNQVKQTEQPMNVRKKRKKIIDSSESEFIPLPEKAESNNQAKPKLFM